MQSTDISNAAMDQARDVLCTEFARMLQSGASTVRVRVVLAGGAPIEAYFYAHRNRRWEIQPDKVTSPELSAAIAATLESLTSHEHHDAWSTKAHAAADYHETDFHFHRDELQTRPGESLVSEMNGLLFRDRHDSKKDIRRSIRTPRHT
jgi:hypothetical protein